MVPKKPLLSTAAARHIHRLFQVHRLLEKLALISSCVDITNKESQEIEFKH